MKLPSIPINLHTRSRAKFGPKMGTGSFSMRVWHLPIALGYQTFSGRADRNEALRVRTYVRTYVRMYVCVCVCVCVYIYTQFAPWWAL
jgi:hypothetical protein